MKRILIIMFALMMLFSMAACGKKTEGEKTPVITGEGHLNASVEKNQQDAPQPQLPTAEVTLEMLMNAEPTPKDQFVFIGSVGGEFWVDAYKGTDSIVVIPDEHEATPITSVSHYTFSEDSPVRALRFNDATTEIADSVCTSNENLKIVVLGSAVRKIGKAAFQSCLSLETVVLNQGLETIDEMVFACCESLKEVTIPDTVTSIAPSAFFGCHDDFIIYGTEGSYAEEYAGKEGIPFIAK